MDYGASGLEVEDSISVCIPDMVIECNNERNLVNITLCICNCDSVSGVRIIKKTNNFPICIMPDKSGDQALVKIYSRDKLTDCLLIGKDKRSEVILRYNDLTKTWYTQ